jgi:hypothetical protein
MRAWDCKDPAHGEMHITGQDNDDLMMKAKQHRDEYHMDMTDEQIEAAVTSDAYDE